MPPAKSSKPKTDYWLLATDAQTHLAQYPAASIASRPGVHRRGAAQGGIILLAQLIPNNGNLCNGAEGIGGPRIAGIICLQELSDLGVS